jgi:DNA polymerase-3 subunit delta'
VEFIGNERAVAAIERAVAGGSPQHAYLFAGPERVGKAALAMRLAQALNCAADGERPCGDCSACRRIASRAHADVFTVTLEPTSEGSQSTAVGVDQMREVERTVALAPYEGRSRVVIIDPADGMTTEAQNAFLKTLEEPPPHVVFVMVSAQPERLLPTVLSRCQRIDFRLVPAEAIESALRERGADGEEARTLARLAAGRPGWSFAMAAEPAMLERRREAIAQTRSFMTLSMAERMKLAEKLAGRFKEKRDDVFDRIHEWESWWRDVLLAQSGAAESAANVDMRSEMEADAQACSQGAVLAFVKALGEAREHLRANVSARLVLEYLMLQVPRATAASAAR